jgi:CheY-like chemotaxis protein
LTSAERAEAKAAARRRSRRARLAQAGRADADSLRDVLLLGPERANAELGSLLQVFGFQVHPATFSADALALIAEMPLAAVFLDVAPGSDEDMDGLELCMEIKQQRAVLAGAVPPVFLLTNRDSAAGRVRAGLAGCDALLARPVTRGDAARALEAADVALPADQRRIERP